jgi:hypothetical protein
MRVSLYQLHRCVWDSIRAAEVSSGPGRSFDANRYDLTTEERKAFDEKDIAELFRMGLHPVLLNAFCRASGYSRDEYRGVLQVFAGQEQRRARWQK